jgi:hypothetical protein
MIMKTISSLFIRPASSQENIINPSLVLKVHREEISGTLELTRLNSEEPCSPLKISWVKKDMEGQMKPVWVNEEMLVI